MADQAGSRGWQGAVLKLLGAGDYRLTVTGRREISPHYLRLSFQAGGMLGARALHPTMWVRMWFADGRRRHQRGYTLVDPDPATDTVDVEFALHDGLASAWARAAQPGDTIAATVLGGSFALPEPRPAGYVIVGDTASLPAINSLLGAIGDAPATVFLEAAYDGDTDLPVARSAGVTWVQRRDAGEALVAAVRSAAFDGGGHFGWVACDSRTTRAAARVLRDDFGIPRKSIKAQAYWVA
ncbi:siderophore-interacting protein [Mycobacterium talmoniae]|uniref:NADPH-dependent ferric siderophore reductase n=1 Tax=Mycobacterium talmoniae TaxID=1858794 RepID=A0A1S1NFC0_9MYCO|nr:siderophore-interacting protein [Mycobacterium talmoniae]OHV04372.1 NADPH-dependent ferric siderophore reductase [Mycobacterium talmoniae]